MKGQKKGAFILCPCPGVDFTRLVWGLEPVPEGVKVVAFVDPILFPGYGCQSLSSSV